MQQFRKRPLVVEAVQLTDSAFDHLHPNPEHVPGVTYDPSTRTASMETLGRPTQAEIGDWIVRTKVGELYPVSPSLFAITYEPIVDIAVTQPAKTNYVQRMVAELADLTWRLDRLVEFVQTPLFGSLGDEDRELLFIQRDAMSAYRSVLSLRLDKAQQLQRNEAARKSMLAGTAGRLHRTGGAH